MIEQSFINFEGLQILENLQTFKAEKTVGGFSVLADFFPRSIVTINVDTCKVYNFQANVRDFSSEAIVKSVVKTFLATERAVKERKDLIAENCEEKTLKSGKKINFESAKITVRNNFKSVLNAHLICATDKNGKIIPNSVFSVCRGERLSQHFSISKSALLWELFVDMKKDFSDASVNVALKNQCAVICGIWNLKKEIDIVIGQVANNSEKDFFSELKKTEKDFSGANEFLKNCAVNLEKADAEVKKSREISEKAKSDLKSAENDLKSANDGLNSVVEKLEGANESEKAALMKAKKEASEKCEKLQAAKNKLFAAANKAERERENKEGAFLKIGSAFNAAKEKAEKLKNRIEYLKNVAV
jgi:uncharacterized protein YukE